MWGIASVHVGVWHQYCRGCSVLWRISLSTAGDNISAAEEVQYVWGIASVRVGDSISTVGITSIL